MEPGKKEIWMERKFQRTVSDGLALRSIRGR